MWLVADAVLRMSTALRDKDRNTSTPARSDAPPSLPSRVSKLTANWAETHSLGKPHQQRSDLFRPDACGTPLIPALAAGPEGSQVAA